MARIRLSLSLLSLCLSPVNTLVVESIVGGAVLGCFGYLAPKMVCQFKECCTDNWIPANITGLQLALLIEARVWTAVSHRDSIERNCGAFQ